jgi:hypothetical protein
MIFVWTKKRWSVKDLGFCLHIEELYHFRSSLNISVNYARDDEVCEASNTNREMVKQFAWKN